MNLNVEASISRSTRHLIESFAHDPYSGQQLPGSAPSSEFQELPTFSTHERKSHLNSSITYGWYIQDEAHL